MTGGRLHLQALRLALVAACALPAAASAAQLDGATLSTAWGVPFAGLLLSIALLPLLAPAFWHRHFGKVTAAWALAFLLPFATRFGPGAAAAGVMHALMAEYLPFVILLTALYTVAGGIHIRADLRGTPAVNTALLAVGAALASVMGTTGASMLLIRPLLRANAHRTHRAHVVVFFIFIVSNAGGALTPLGDPPLFLGFLKGVDFFWTVTHIGPQTLWLVGMLLVVFHALDAWQLRRDPAAMTAPAPAPAPAPASAGVTPRRVRIGFDGRINFVLLALAVSLVLTSGVWKSPLAWNVAGTTVGLPGLVRDVGLVGVTLLSLALTPRGVHAANQFSWAPMQEVAKLFAGIFVTIVPVISMLQAGAAGPFGAVVAAVTRPDGLPDTAAYFWATGLLSSFLDNAPTYLVFFNTAGADPVALMTVMAPTLAAISAGAVFMGANTYIGNAPNLMVKAIAEDRGVKMPSFFGYMLWSFGILVPLFVAMTFVWFR